MFRRLELIDEAGSGTVMVYDGVADAISCRPPRRRYAVNAEPVEGQSRYDALVTAMQAQDPEG